MTMPDGTLRIQGFEDWLLRDAIGAETDAELPHGAWTIVGGFRGMGAGLDGLFEQLGAGVADGVMFGGCRIEQLRPLLRDRDYVVRCTVVGSQRRHGRRVPVFDVVEYVTEIADDDGTAVRTTSSMIIPRPGVSG